MAQARIISGWIMYNYEEERHPFFLGGQKGNIWLNAVYKGIYK